MLMRAEWDLQRYLASRRLMRVLPPFLTPNADIYGVYPEHHRASRRVRALVDFVVEDVSSYG